MLTACMLRPHRFNAVRTRKPQTFKVEAGAGIVDPTDGGKRCDFCNWRTLTAEVRTCVTQGGGLGRLGHPCRGDACVHRAVRRADIGVGA